MADLPGPRDRIYPPLKLQLGLLGSVDSSSPLLSLVLLGHFTPPFQSLRTEDISHVLNRLLTRLH
jgi:hypothetical protein